MRALAPIAPLPLLLGALLPLVCGAACGGPAGPRAPESAPPTTSAAAGERRVLAAPGSSRPTADPEFVRAMAETRTFGLGTPRNATPTPDGRAVVFLRSAARDPKQSLWELDVATGTERELLSPTTVSNEPETLSTQERARRERLRITTSGFTAFELTRDGTRVVVTLSGRVIVVERATGRWQRLDTGPGPVIDPHLSPDGKRVAYVRNDDLWAIDLEKGAARAPVQITRGGSQLKPHAMAEFIAQEEFGRSTGYWWSPDGARFLYEEADLTKVERLAIGDPAHPENDPDRPSYPRAGKPNADVRLGIVSARGEKAGATTWVDWDRQRYPYLANVVWGETGPATIYLMDRLQRNALLLAVDPATGKTTILLTEHDDAWINVDSDMPKWLPDGAFLWSSERSGKWAIELRDKAGRPLQTYDETDFVYQQILALDEKRRVAWVNGSKEPTETRVYRIALHPGHPNEVTHGPADFGGKFDRGHEVFCTYEGSPTGERAWRVRSTKDGRVLSTLQSVAETPSTLRRVDVDKVGADQFRVAIVRPQGFDPTRKYPVIDAAYGGPHVRVVHLDGIKYARSAWIADATDAIVVHIDARGTPNRGRAWERAIKDSFARTPLEGHVAALRALAAKHPEMDPARVGVFGWSFGGYYSALAVLARPDVYRVAVAGAPVADWRDYDTAYSERYLGLPGDGGGSVYDQNALSTFAKNAGLGDVMRPLLIAHGTADDNVYFLHSLKLVDALTRAGHPFGFLPLAGVTHQLADPALAEAFWNRATGYLREHLASR